MNLHHLKKCKEALLAKQRGEDVDLSHCSFTNMSIVKELEILQKLIDIYDQIVCDNGYRLRHGHPSLKMPKQSPAVNDQGGQVTPLAAAHKRGCMAVRNGHERVNGWIKRYKFCRCKIHAWDIPKLPSVWRIGLGDMVRYGITLTTDSESMTLLSEKIIDMMHVAVNQMDIYWTDLKFKNQAKKASNKTAQSNLKKDLVVKVGDVDYCMICDEKYPKGTIWSEHKESDKHKACRNKRLKANNKSTSTTIRRKKNKSHNVRKNKHKSCKPTRRSNRYSLRKSIDDPVCSNHLCSKKNPNHLCPGCEYSPVVAYCSQHCRKNHWSIHKETCKKGRYSQMVLLKDQEESDDDDDDDEQSDDDDDDDEEIDDNHNHNKNKRKRKLQNQDDNEQENPKKRVKYNQRGDDGIITESSDSDSTEEDYASSVVTQSSDSDDINSEHETDTEAEDQSHDEGIDEDIDVDDDKNWILLAKGWPQITHCIKTHELFRNIFGTPQDQKVQKQDVDNYLGKDWEWKTSLGYIKKLKFDSEDVALYIHRINKWVTKWVNVRSKWRSSQKYVVMMGFHEVFLHNQSQLKVFYEEENKENEAKKIKIKDDETHWYNWMKDGETKKVSTYLSQKYKDDQKTLEQRRVARMMRSRKFYYGNINVGVMNKEDLLYFAREHSVKIPKKMNKKVTIRNYVLEELRKRHKKDWENNQICHNEGCSNKMNGRCPNCKGAFYCGRSCAKEHYKQHKSQCSQLFAAQHKEFVGSQISLFPSFESIEELRKDSDVPPSLQHLTKYPIQKSWFDLDFGLFESELARLQQRCSCRSGVQLPGVCSHAGCILRLIYYILFLEVHDLLKKNKRDQLICDKICDLTPFSKEQKRFREENDHLCPVCRTPIKEDQESVQCDGCNRWYHPSCIKTTLEDINKDLFITTVFHCRMCSTSDVWMVRST